MGSGNTCQNCCCLFWSCFFQAGGVGVCHHHKHHSVRNGVGIWSIWCCRLFFFYLRRTAGFYIFRGNSQGNGKPDRMCIFRACGVEIPVCVDLLFAAVELWTLKTMMVKKHVPQKQKTKNTCLSFSCSDLLSRESGLHLLTNPSFLTSSSSWHSPDPHKYETVLPLLICTLLVYGCLFI